MIGLYIHIPFCLKKCHYCDFVTTGSGDAQKHASFLSAFKKECAHHAKKFEDRIFDTLYVGGGTPSALNIAETEGFFKVVRDHFKIKPQAEVTWEANPGEVDGAKAKVYRKLGINRVSLGAQSFKDETLRAINRDHGAREIKISFDHLRNAGIGNINLDLILYLPGETRDDLAYSLESLAAIDPEHVSIYELSVEEGTVFGQKAKKGELSLPPEETQLETLSFVRNFLKQHGYAHYELLNYSKPGFESMHNRLYWANEEVLGLGPGAYSYTAGRRSRFVTSHEDYLKKIALGDWTCAEEETLAIDKKEIESFILALRLTEGAESGRFQNAITRLSTNIQTLISADLLERTAERIRLTPRGQLLAETVFSQLSIPD
ncbi:MAG TPA: radical SAM family heme chaperone HemW [Candidatus Omnitrophota bacterium]|nr:radical SAM family heme chaperone HemW [Candidatus Omnitrophota bacterium]